MQNSSCLGVVLTGGHSSRMGQDKALLSRTDSQNTMLDFSHALLKKVGVDHVVISGNKHGLTDKVEQLGPVGGIYSVIEKYQPRALLIMPVDLPLMSHHCLNQLKRSGELSNKASYFQDNYLPLYLPINAFVEQFFNVHFKQKEMSLNSNTSHREKGPSIRALLAKMPSQAIQSKRKLSLFNANTPEQWQKAQQQLTQSNLSKVKNPYV